MKINNKIIIGVLSIILITTGITLDRNLAPVPPNFIYAKHNEYYYQGKFDYCVEENSGCYLKESAYCIQENVEKCTPKVCVPEIQNTEMMTKESYNHYSEMQEKKFAIIQKECTLARIKAGEEIYIYNSKNKISKKATDVPEFATSNWEYNYHSGYDGSIFGNNDKATFSSGNSKYRANLPQNSEFISFIK